MIIEFDASLTYKSKWITLPANGLFSCEVQFRSLDATDGEFYFEAANENPAKGDSGGKIEASVSTPFAVNENILIRMGEPLAASFVRAVWTPGTATTGTVKAIFNL